MFKEFLILKQSTVQWWNWRTKTTMTAAWFTGKNNKLLKVSKFWKNCPNFLASVQCRRRNSRSKGRKGKAKVHETQEICLDQSQIWTAQAETKIHETQTQDPEKVLRCAICSEILCSHSIFSLYFRRSDEESESDDLKIVSVKLEATEPFSILPHPRLSHIASTSSESRRKSTPPTRIAPVPDFQTGKVTNAVRVKGVIREASNSKCLYLLVDASS